MTNLKESRTQLFSQWSREKEVVDGIQKVKSDIEQLRLQAERAEREGDYGKVAEIRYGKLQAAQEELDAFQIELHKQQT